MGVGSNFLVSCCMVSLDIGQAENKIEVSDEMHKKKIEVSD